MSKIVFNKLTEENRCYDQFKGKFKHQQLEMRK